MDAILEQLVFWHWFAFAVFLIILDVAVGANFLFIWCGLSAALVGVLMLFFPITWEYQFLIFGLGVMASLLVWRKLKTRIRTDNLTLNRRAQYYVGRVFTLDLPIVNGRGKVKVDDTMWIVEGPDLPAGSKVKVVGVDGVVLKIEQMP